LSLKLRKSKDMKNFFLVPNLDKPESLPLAEKFRDLSRIAGGDSVIFLPKEDHAFPAAEDVPEAAEAVIVFGGDGTIIHTATAFSERNIPVFGINTGTVGFLSSCEAENTEQAFSALSRGDYRVDERMLLRFRALRGGEIIAEGLALNDVTVRLRTGGKALSYDLLISDELVSRFSADGMIVSTPTGSTAYNLSAGGPIALPGASAILATPLCPHSLFSGSFVLPDDVCVTIRLSGERENDAVVYYDSFSCPGLRAGDEVRVMKADRCVRLIRIGGASFYDTLRNKLRF